MQPQEPTGAPQQPEQPSQPEPTVIGPQTTPPSGQPPRQPDPGIQSPPQPQQPGVPPQQPSQVTPQPQPASVNMGGSATGGKSKLPLIIAAAVIGVIIGLVAVGLAVSSFLGNEDESPSTYLEDGTADDFEFLDEEEEETEQKEIQKIDTTLDAKAIGVRVTASEMVRPVALMSSSGYLEKPFEDDVEWMLLKITAKNYGELSVVFSASTLEIETSSGERIRNSFAMSNDTLKSAGFERMTSESIKNESGEDTVTGYVLYEVPKGETDLQLVWDIDTKVLFGDDIKETYKVKIQ